MSSLGKATVLLGVGAVMVFLILLTIFREAQSFLGDPATPIQIEMHYPTPPPANYRAVARIAQDMDTEDGMPGSDANPDPLDGTESYIWVGEGTFHVADRAPISTRRITLPGCFDPDETSQRYLYTHPEDLGELQSLLIGGLSKLDEWEKTDTGYLVDTESFLVYVSESRLNCTTSGGVVMEVHP